jgi:hypothetical protein
MTHRLTITETTVPRHKPGVLQSPFRLGNFDAWFLDFTAAAAGAEASTTGEPRLA